MNKHLFAICFLLNTLIACCFLQKHHDKQQFVQYHTHVSSIDNMPMVTDDPFAALAYGGEPIEQRTPEYRKWLCLGVKILVRNASGSGTIVYYDPEEKWAYIQSCGHLWSGNMTAEEGKNSNLTCNIEVWYHNSVKLQKSVKYPATVLYYSNNRGQDVSLLRFKPDWQPDWLPIGPADFKYEPNMRLHSIGCDEGSEIAHYDVQYIGFRDNDLVTTENSPRPGRSGGGLLTGEYFVGVCWGTTNRDGSGNGYFTPLSVVREFNQKNGFGWLNEASPWLAREIPIIDRNSPQQKYPKDFIPLPNSK